MILQQYVYLPVFALQHLKAENWKNNKILEKLRKKNAKFQVQEQIIVSVEKNLFAGNESNLCF